MKFLNVLVSSAVLILVTPISDVVALPSRDTFFGKTLLPECVYKVKYGALAFKKVTVPDCRESTECCHWMIKHYDDMVSLYKNLIADERLQSLRKGIEGNKSLQPIYIMLLDYEISYNRRFKCG